MASTRHKQHGSTKAQGPWRYNRRAILTMISTSVFVALYSLLRLFVAVSGFSPTSGNCQTITIYRTLHHVALYSTRSHPPLEGLIDDFEDKNRLHDTLRSLQVQIPTLLTKPITENDPLYSSSSQLVTGPYVLSRSRADLASLSESLILASQTTWSSQSVEGRIGIAGDRSLKVHWKAKLVPRIGGAIQVLEGDSELELDTNFRIKVHRLLQVQWEKRVLDPATIGPALQVVVATVLNLQKQSLWPGSSAVLSRILKESNVDATSSSVQLYLISGAQWEPLVEETKGNPLPGSQGWDRYVAAHRQLNEWVDLALLALATQPSIECFDPKVVFETVDPQLRLQGAQQVARLYQTMTALRTVAGPWTLEKASVLQWEGPPRIQVDYTSQRPGNSPIQGTDIYVLTESGHRRIVRVEQKKLIVGGSPQESVWLMRSLVRAAETGALRSVEGVWMDLLQRNARTNPIDSARSPSPSASIRSPESAAAIYFIMLSLHDEWKGLLDASRSSVPPALVSMTENVRLLGYLDEPLVRGKPAYSRNLGLVVASLHAALRSGRLTVNGDPITRVELSENGSIWIRFTVSFVLQALKGVPGLGRLNGANLPIELSLVSEYIVDDEGRIVVHRLVESRVNGQPTPADIVSRWLKGQPDGLRALADTLNWLDARKT